MMVTHGTSRPRAVGVPSQVWDEVPNLLSLLLFMAGTALIFRSWEFALIVTASLGFHEVGHVLALSLYKLEGRISFGLVGAWTSSSQEARRRLPQLANVYIHLAGPLFSLLLATIALTLHSAWQPESRHLLILANFSAQVGLLNLIPAGPMTDGGKIVQRMFGAIDRKRRVWTIFIPMALTALIVSLYFLVELPRLNSRNSYSFLLGLLLTGVWMAASMFLEARSSRHAAAASGSSRPMTPREVNFITVIMWNMLAYYLLLISATPFWLEPDYVMGSLQNIVDIMRMVASVI